MANGSFIPYNSFLQLLCSSAMSFSNDNIAAILLNNSYAPNVATHKYLADLSTYEIPSTGGYVRQSVSSKTVTLNGTGQTVFDCADIDFGSNVSLTARYLVLVDITPATDATRPLLGYVDLNNGGSVPVTSVNSSFRIDINVSGLYAITPIS